MHDVNIDHQHEDLSDADSDAIAQAIWEQETVELRTIGIDIGSSTSHLLFARVTLKRLSQGLSSRFVVTSREVLWRSPIVLTPFLLDGTIDAHSLEHFVHDSYHSAGLKRSDVDTGAVILTGEAIKKKNARAIDEIFAEEAGKFVCATAGHKLECILAAHGSGATAVSKKRAECGLHVDIGGGTTKLALIENGEITSVAAFAVGGRLLAQDKSGAWTRIDDSIYLAAKDLNIVPTSTEFANLATRQAIAKRLAAIVADQITGTPLDSLGQSLDLTEPLSRMPQPRFLTFSGGVSEYMFGRETTASPSPS
jgi:ethanolamine utilization protein EutA